MQTAIMLKTFWELRNNIMHDQKFVVSKKEFISFTDIGLRIMKILNNKKNEILEGKMEHIGLN